MSFCSCLHGITVVLLVHGAFCVSSFDRRLLAAAPTEEVFDFVEDTQGWVNGRATFVGPTPEYLAQFQNSSSGESPFGTPQAGSCGYYNGADSSDYSAVIVPAIMRAAAVASNPDFAGVCGRCYEVQCVSGTVIGNYSQTAGTNISLPLNLTIANPPYMFPLSNSTKGQYPVDDNGTAFPGNNGTAQNVLDVQCYSQNTSTSVIIKVTDSCLCAITSTDAEGTVTVTGVNQPCCTNVPHFNIDYHAFEALAHPDYGYMNMRFRPVDCTSHQLVQPYVPGLVNTTVFGTKPEVGWGVSTYPNHVSDPGANRVYAVDQELITQRLDQNLTPQNGSCFTFPSGKEYSVGLKLFCQNCDETGEQPFALSKSSGIELTIESAAPQQTGSNFVDGLVVGIDQVPSLTFNMGNNSADGSTPCSNPISTGNAPVLLTNLSAAMSATPDSFTGLYQLRLLWQNNAGLGFFPCVANMSLMSSIDIAPLNVLPPGNNAGLSLQVSFCLANITILPTSLVSDERVASLPPTPQVEGTPLYNCFSSDPQPVNQLGQYVDMWGVYPNAVNISSTSSSYQPNDLNGFTAFNHTDLQNFTDLHAIAGQATCIAAGAAGAQYASLMTTCMAGPPATTQCCVDLATDSQAQAANLPHILASICNSIEAASNQVCQAFTWDDEQQRGYFKGGPVDSQYKLDQLQSNFTLCNSPNVTTWVLNAAWMGQGKNDTRAMSLQILGQGKSASSGKSWAKKVWSIGATIAGICSSLLAIAVWVLLFNSYRLEKKMLVKQVVKHLQASDICNIAGGSAAAVPTPNPIMTTANSISSSGHLLLDVPSSGIVPGLTMRRSAPADPFFYDPDDGIIPSEPAKDIQQVAKEITLRCLQRWDGFMGFRASTDSLGRQSGIWRERFDGVRFASLLLAFRKLNAALAFNQPGDSGSLLETWTQSNFKHQGMIVSQLAKVLQSIPTEEAQALPDKDPETIGINDRLCGCWKACSQCLCCDKSK